MSKIRLMLVDDHEVVRLGMRAAFELEPDITIVGEASNGAEAVAKVGVLAPQVILMDVRMEKMSGIEACREIKSRDPQVNILMITSYTDERAILASTLAGASGYLLQKRESCRTAQGHSPGRHRGLAARSQTEAASAHDRDGKCA